ncbi:Serine-aspartate repeat-containing protein D precursor [Rosistilla carotiformis]|uniref:Serine-aspartate repeat-containing protein D n=1 Tax=Rosistilla carotiformis TaxID=2528017 RepID=A0A518JWH3_9BACT|nr:SdrD B-like domain-containing protein [Rosistilla carotiformis]QDV69892.1 Serine-aspartate repeat-containing protein D precursor [Rosistilla carotiformis]
MVFQRALNKFLRSKTPSAAAIRRLRTVERLEARCVMDAALPIHVGLVYIETDYLETSFGHDTIDEGDDSRPDQFQLSFVGGADGTSLSKLSINLDKDNDGFTVGDAIFDTKAGGRGTAGYHDFKVVSLLSSNPAASVTATVSDGGMLLELEFNNFQAGDKLIFSLDVDEILKVSDDVEFFNSRLDVIKSGQEFHDSILTATFEAPHYFDITVSNIFENKYGDPKSLYGIDLPPDAGNDVLSHADRTAAALVTLQQAPKPISIAGTVYLDNDLNLVQSGSEKGIADVSLHLYLLNETSGQFESTGHSTKTDANGDYRFGTELGLLPGTYRIEETQPTGLFSVGAVPGTIDGSVIGTVLNDDVLTGIEIPLGDLHAVDYDFAEADPAKISGFVYRDDDDDGIKDVGEVGLGGVTIRLIPVDTIAPEEIVETTTAADGSYSFTNLAPGRYRVVETVMPHDLSDGLDTAGTVDGILVGAAVNPGDEINDIDLQGGSVGIDYNFGELPLGSLAGAVYLVAPGEDCFGPHDESNDIPLEDVRIVLEDSAGNFIAETRTNSLGEYEFDRLVKGNYRIIEYTPVGLLEGAAHVGVIDGQMVGSVDGGSRITTITLAAGGVGTEYDFCEAAPASISGYVYHDQSNDGIRDATETPIPGARVDLIDSTGVVVASRQTDANGFYKFDNLLPGNYTLRETTPAGYLDGLDTAGIIAGATVGRADNPGDRIVEITLKQGLAGVEYNFGELKPAQISGRVHVDTDGDCEIDPDELMLSGVVVELYDAAGNFLQRTTTNDAGVYQFTNLMPGNYTVVEIQPVGYYDGDQHAGTTGGNDSVINRISQIPLSSGDNSQFNDFCELPPGTISGYVHVDTDGDCVRDPDELLLAGVIIELYDNTGTLIATTTTNTLGRYEFTDLAPGEYTVVELQPTGYYDGDQHAGTTGGDDSVTNRISQIPLAAGQDSESNDFCELPPGSISGYVHVDTDGDCVRDPDELLLAGVTIELYDSNGTLIMTTTTDINGRYQFTDLAPGDYTVVELQPTGYYDGDQHAGTTGGDDSVTNRISQIPLAAGQDSESNDFCELPPGSISGYVHVDTDGDCIRDPDEELLANVEMQLYSADGTLVATTLTNTAGFYEFKEIAPGSYSVIQVQPTGYFDGDQHAGTTGGDDSGINQIVAIGLLANQHSLNNDFCELPPAMISGYVFQDGGVRLLSQVPDPKDLRGISDGLRTGDDTPLAGVTLELRNVLGQAFLGENALPGVYGDGPIRVVTDANGYYEFTGLRAATYHIYQIQPDGYIDGLDTAGSLGGFAVNAADEPEDSTTTFQLQTLALDSATNPNNDGIILIDLPVGGASVENNFSEVLIDKIPSIPPVEWNPPPIQVIQPPIEQFPVAPLLINFADAIEINHPIWANDDPGFTWHLSVIDGGFPRGETALQSSGGKVIQNAGIVLDTAAWTNNLREKGNWILMDREGNVLPQSSSMLLGDDDAIALAGDFNGDGRDELALFIEGHWFIDVNGNGKWDGNDLYIQLGNEMDRPVVGDWDGDGKDDIGIFGPEWDRDPEAIVRDPGLPDPDNIRRLRPKNQPPMHPEATDGHRVLQLREHGQVRSDLIDHVFRYGHNADTPLAGDWNGDGIDTIAIYRAGRWMLDSDGDGRWTSRDETVQFGEPGDLPIVGDWNGDGIDDLGVVRGNTWILDSNSDRQISADDTRFDQPHSPNGQPVAGDWNGDGASEAGVYETQSDPVAEDKAA